MDPTTMRCLILSSSRFVRRYLSLLFGFSVLLSSLTFGFNLDAPSAVHLFNADARNGNFGASIAAYEDQRRPWVLIGAPFAVNRQGQPSGQTYTCNVFKDSCKRLPIRPQPPPFHTADQGLGTTVAAFKKSGDGIILTCAPRLQLSRRKKKNTTEGRIDGTGECYAYLGKSSKYVTINPCRSTNDMGSCLAGFSAALNSRKESIQIALGLPFAFVSEGNLFLGTYKQNGETVNTVMLKAQKSDWNGKGFALGYAVVLANLRPDEKDESDIITSSPMWVDNGYRGVIVVTDKDMQSEDAFVIRDTMGHVGSFFGHSLAALDLDGDRILDLVVGSPYYSEGKNVDVGVVYVFYGASRGGYYRTRGNPTILKGPNVNGRFGHVVADLGDIDGDGLSDLGVGCPYCGNESRGAVFIYLSKRGMRIKKPADQVIEASSLLNNFKQTVTSDLFKKSDKAPPLKKFGWSLSGGADFDHNSVPDLAVGAPESDIVTYMRGKPTGRLSLLPNRTKLPKAITFDGLWCRNDMNRENRECQFKLQFALQLVTWPKTEKRSFEFEFTFDFDSMLKRKDEKRIKFVASDSRRRYNPIVTLKQNRSISQEPTEFSFTLEPIRKRFEKNKWQPVQISFHARPLWNQNSTYSKNLKFNALPVILHPDSLTKYTFRDVYINNRDCSSKVCRSDLSVSITENRTHSNNTQPGVVYYGATREVRRLEVVVVNRGEPAYNTRLLLRFPKGVHFSTQSTPRYDCTEKEIANTSYSESDLFKLGERTTVECVLPTTITKRLPGSNQPNVQITFFVKPSKAIVNEELRRNPTLVFTAEALSENPDTDLSNNVREIRYNLRVYSRVQLDPSPESGEGVVIDSRNVTLQIQSNQLLYADSIGPELRHVYRLTNFGPSPAPRIDVNISVPLYSQSMQQLLYILPRVKNIKTGRGKAEQESASKMPRVVNSEGEKRGDCVIDDRFVDLYQLRALQSVKRQRRNRRSTDEVVSVDTTKAKDEASSEASTQRGSFLQAWRSRRVEEVRCDQKDSEFGDIFCATVRCTVHNLTRNEVVRIVFEARLWADTYFREKTSDVAISTLAVGRLASTLDGVPVSPPLKLRPLRIQQTFIFHGIQNLVTKQIPWWPVLVATFLGLVLLGLIILVMWKCGFFKRHRPSDKEYMM